MSLYTALVRADSPLFTYYPDPGYNTIENWVTAYTQTDFPVVYYETSASIASVQFDFYGDEFELGGEPGCAYNVSINGILQNQTFYQPFNLPVGQYHVELDVACAEGQSMTFEDVIFAESQGAVGLEDLLYYLTPDQVLAIGKWQEKDVYSEYFLRNFTQFQTLAYGSTLGYSFKGVQTTIVGSVGPHGGEYLVTVDGKPSKVLSTVRPAYDDDATLWVTQYLDPDTTHHVTITNLGRNLTVRALSYDVL